MLDKRWGMLNFQPFAERHAKILGEINECRKLDTQNLIPNGLPAPREMRFSVSLSVPQVLKIIRFIKWKSAVRPPREKDLEKRERFVSAPEMLKFSEFYLETLPI